MSKHIPGEGAGKGDTPRPVDKKAYDETWIRCFGEECVACKGKGEILKYLDPDPLYNPMPHDILWEKCLVCNGIGKVDRKR